MTRIEAIKKAEEYYFLVANTYEAKGYPIFVVGGLDIQQTPMGFDVHVKSILNPNGNIYSHSLDKFLLAYNVRKD